MNRPLISPYSFLDTPALLIDREVLIDNIERMQKKADRFKVDLRPHTKTHKMPAVAAMQTAAGAAGIAVAKPEEAEEMARHGQKDIFIANEVVGQTKLRRLRGLGETVRLSFGADGLDGLRQIEAAFEGAGAKARVLIEVETGENRSGVVEESTFLTLAGFLKQAKNIEFRGVFSHEGFTYRAGSKEECLEQFEDCQKRTLLFARLAEKEGLSCPTVSVGATPTALFATGLLPGVTELRPGTYALMDVAQGNAAGTYDHCAATVLTTIISKPTESRLIGDVGAKGITAQTRPEGICKTEGYGFIAGSGDVYAHAVYDEHMILYSDRLEKLLSVGDKIEVIPNHICPVCNLYDQAYLVSGGKVVETIPVSCRGKLR